MHRLWGLPQCGSPLLMVISLSEMELQAPEPNGQGGRLGAGGGAAGG